MENQLKLRRFACRIHDAAALCGEEDGNTEDLVGILFDPPRCKCFHSAFPAFVLISHNGEAIRCATCNLTLWTWQAEQETRQLERIAASWAAQKSR